MSHAHDEPEAIRDLAYYEAVPYLLVIESVERGGEWLRRAEYPELAGCAAEARSRALMSVDTPPCPSADR